MNRRFVAPVVSMILACSIVSVLAVPPSLINYQGRLVDGAGLVNGEVGLAIRLFNGNDDMVYEDSNTVTVVDGLYTLMLGDNTTSGDLAAALTNAQLWIEVVVDGVTLSPRERMVSVAYALSAKETDPLWAAQKGSYATGTPLYVFEESDPVWNAQKSAYATGTPLYAYTETDPVWTSERAGYATGTPVYAETDPVWAAEKSGYATGTPLYAFTEVDPVWTASITGYYHKTEADGRYVNVVGDTMTGALTVQTNISLSYSADRGSGARSILSIVGGDDVEIGNSANGYDYGVAVGLQANGSYWGAAVGSSANGGINGAVVGWAASGYDMGAAVGYQARANNHGAAIGEEANGNDHGSVVGAQARGDNYGAAVGWQANGSASGVAIGRNVTGFNGGSALGYWASAYNYGAAVGYNASAYNTNVAVGYNASAGGGTERIAIGHNVANDINNSARIRGTLYLDGGTGVYYRSAFGSGAWLNLLDGMATGMPIYAETDPVWAAEKSGYATGTPLYLETDPNAVLADGSRAMTGDLDMGGNSITNVAGGSIVFEDGTAISAAGVQNWNTGKVTIADWLSADSTTNSVKRSGDTMTGSLNINADAERTLIIGSSGTNIAIGGGANGLNSGVALGRTANGASGTAVGRLANGFQGVAVGNGANGNSGAALGWGANAWQNGSAVGLNAYGASFGSAVGESARGSSFGAAVGLGANGNTCGAALGATANASDYGVSIGWASYGTKSDIAIGCFANAGSGSERIAIGNCITNSIDNSAAIRGTLYVDGGTGIYYRATFGSGVWIPFSPVLTNFVQKTGDTMTGTLSNQSSVTSARFVNSQNSATGVNAAAMGGAGNIADSDYAFVGGGMDNSAGGMNATVGGGVNNAASGEGSTIAGGGSTESDPNEASGTLSAIGGGAGNVASNTYATVPGGIQNTAGGYYSFAAGRRAKAYHDGSFVLTDGQGADFASANENTFNARFENGYYLAGGTIYGGDLETTGSVKSVRYYLSATAWLELDSSGTNLLFVANSVTNTVGLTPQ